MGSFNIQWNYYLFAQHSNPKIQTKSIALTFDDGPHETITPKVIALLEKYNTKATFFCIGKNIEKYPKQFQALIQAGHSVGNHSYSHVNQFGFFSVSKVIEEINRTDTLAEQLTGKKMKLFRPPFGVSNPHIANAISQTGHQVIGWSVRSFDTVIKEEPTILKRITKGLKAGDIILLHDNRERTLHVLEKLLIFLEKNQFKTLSVEALFEEKQN